MGKTQNLQDAYNTIQSGKIINVNGCRICISESRHICDYGKKYIYWRHYGQSAVKLGIDNLRWIMKVIAESKDYSFTIVESWY